jgi:hypothetical protein
MQTGDFILTGRAEQTAVSWAIKLGAKLRDYPESARRYNHAALVLNEHGDLAEALGGGVKRTHISKYRDDDYTYVVTDITPSDQAQVLAFAENVLASRTKYGFVTFVGLGLYCVTGGKLCIQKAGTAICSGFVSDALTRAGFIWPRPPFAMMPADLAAYFGV